MAKSVTFLFQTDDKITNKHLFGKGGDEKSATN